MKLTRLAGLLVFAISGLAKADSDYSFELNGEEVSPVVRSLNGTPDEPAPGDAIFLYRSAIVLGEPGHYAFESQQREASKESLLFQKIGGERILVSVHLDPVYSDDGKPEASILTTLTDNEIAQVSGVHLERWDAEIQKQLARLNPARTIFVVEDDILREGGSLANLPQKIAYLLVDTSSSDTVWDFESLRGQTDLRLLRIDHFGGQRFDVELISAAAGLRIFDGGGTDLDNLGKLGELNELRVVDLSWNETAKHVRFAAALPELRRLAVRSTMVGDLSPVAGLTKLESIDANDAPVSVLPDAELPSLKTLEVMSSRLTKEQVEAFAARNPQLEIWHDWGEALRRALTEVSRVRVRSGGTCHRRISEEKTLFEVDEKAEIEKLVDAIRMAEDPSHGHCMCCGNPSMEFYEGEELVATLGFHHGRSLRWPGGWPGDGAITMESAHQLCLFLDKRGVSGPLQEFEEGRRREAAMERRHARYLDLIPDAVLAGLRNGDGPAAFSEENLPGAGNRALLCFRLFGCHEDSWNLGAGLDEMLEEALLKQFDLALIQKEVLPHVAGDHELRNGVARWVFERRNREKFTPEALGEHFGILAAHGLAHPRERSRFRTLSALADHGGEASIAVLRKCLASEIPVRELDEQLLEEPGGQVSFSPSQLEIPDGASVEAGAAIVLSMLGDRESLPLIENQAAAAKTEPNREAFKAAVSGLK